MDGPKGPKGTGIIATKLKAARRAREELLAELPQPAAPVTERDLQLSEKATQQVVDGVAGELAELLAKADEELLELVNQVSALQNARDVQHQALVALELRLAKFEAHVTATTTTQVPTHG